MVHAPIESSEISLPSNNLVDSEDNEELDCPKHHLLILQSQTVNELTYLLKEHQTICQACRGIDRFPADSQPPKNGVSNNDFRTITQKGNAKQ